MGIEVLLTSFSVKQELTILNNGDAPSRGIAMNALRKHLDQLEADAVPDFLKLVCDAAQKFKASSYIYAVSLLEIAARKHGLNLVSHVRIMTCMLATALKAQESTIGLHQACAKLVRSISNYIIYPARLASKREQMLWDLCSPLLKNITEAPKCLHVVVENRSWKYAPEDLVFEACLQATRAFMVVKGSQGIDHMQLICSIAKKNGEVMKPHGGALIKVAVELFDDGICNGNWKKRLWAVQIINGLLRSVNVLEIPKIIGVLERQRQDKMSSVRKVVVETIQRAKLLSENPCFQESIEADSGFNVFTNTQWNSVEEDGTSSPGESSFQESMEEHRDAVNKNSSIEDWIANQEPFADIQDKKSMVEDENEKKSMTDGSSKESVMLEGPHENQENRSTDSLQEKCSPDCSCFGGSLPLSSDSCHDLLMLENPEDHEENSSSSGEAQSANMMSFNMREESLFKMVQEENCAGYCWWKKMGQRSLISAYRRRWMKASGSIEFILRASLCAVFIVPAALMSIKCLSVPEEYHVLVPT